MTKFTFCIQGRLDRVSDDRRQLADQMLTYLEALAEIDPVLRDWYRPGKSRQDALSHPLVLAGVRVTGAARLLVGENGSFESDWSRSMWNGRDLGDERSVRLSVELPPAPPILGNNLSLTYSRSGHPTTTPLSLVESIMRASASSWPISWSRAFSHDVLDRVSDDWKDITAGWVTYLAGDVDVSVPDGIQVTRGFADRGTLFVVSDDNPSPDNATAVERLRILTHLFWDLGLLPRRSHAAGPA